MNDTRMMKNKFARTLLTSSLLINCGCSSIMTHTGGEPGSYPGTRASYDMLTGDDTSWSYKPFVVLDLPFTAVMDTLLLPWDLYRRNNSVKSRVEDSERKNQQINAVIPPA